MYTQRFFNDGVTQRTNAVYKAVPVGDETDPLINNGGFQKSSTGWPTAAIITASVLGVLFVGAAIAAIVFGVLYGNEKIAPDDPNYPLVGKLVLEWNDEFNSGHLDRNKWASQSLTGRQTGNNEHQCYISLDEPDGHKYTKVQNGNLVLRAESVTPYTVGPSGTEYIANASKVYSRNMCHYGYTEVRYKAEPKDYVLASISMFTLITENSEESPNFPEVHNPYENWPRVGQIEMASIYGIYEPTDFAEGSGVNRVNSAVIHTGPDFWNAKFINGVESDIQPSLPNFADGQFHTIGLEKTYDYLRFWMDATVVGGKITGGTLIHEVSRDQWQTVNGIGAVGDKNKPFDQPLPVTMNVGVLRPGGGPGAWQSGDNTPDLPYEMEIDFVRYYKFDGNPHHVHVDPPPKRVAQKSVPAKRASKRVMHLPPHPPVTLANIGVILSEVVPAVTRSGDVENRNALVEEVLNELMANMQAAHQQRVPAARASPRRTRSSHETPPLVLAWKQDFDNRQLDLDFWRRREVSATYLDFNGFASTADDVRTSFVEDGTLKIKAFQQENLYPGYFKPFPVVPPDMISNITTGSLISKNACVGKGYVEFRAKFPVADSMVPRIILTRGTKSTEKDQITTVPAGAIIVSQQQGLNNPDKSEIFFIDGGPGGGDGSDYRASPTILVDVPNRDQYHKYGLEMTPDGEINWWLDATVDPVTKKLTGGTLLHSLSVEEYNAVRTDGNLENPLSPFDDDLFIVLSLVPGGEMTGNPDSTGDLNTYNVINDAFNMLIPPPFPYEILDDTAFEIDYIHHYKYH